MLYIELLQLHTLTLFLLFASHFASLFIWYLTPLCKPILKSFVSGDAACLGKGTAESLLGYAMRLPDTDTPRSLRLCVSAGTAGTAGTAGGVMHHQLERLCDAGETQLEHLGFVH